MERAHTAPTPAGALSRLKVIELGQGVAAPYGARLLADLGADVVKVERPGGDPLRADGPFHPDDRDRREPGLFGYVNANKRGVALDPRRDTERLRALILASDVLIEDQGPGVLESLGLDPRELREHAPQLCVVRLSDHGQTGPYRDRTATPYTLQAAAGLITPRGGTEPVPVGGRYLEFVAGGYLAAAALTVRHGALRSGSGQDVDMSLMECFHSVLTFPTVTNRVLKLLGRAPLRSENVVLGVKRCRDGWVGVNILTGQQWHDICEIMGAAEYIDLREELRQPGPLRDDFERRADAWLAEMTTDEVVALGQALRIPVVPVNDGESILRTAQWTERADFFVPEGRAVRPSFPWRFALTPAASRRPAPAYGEHNDDPSVTARPEGDDDPATVTPRTAAPRAAALPLEGLRVVDFGTFWAGGSHGTFLGAMGADVIKIESVQKPDGFRFNMASPELGPQWYEAGRARAVNLNKRDVTLDLSRAEGRELCARLIAGADVVAENYSARVLEHFGLDWDGVRAINPDIVMVRMPGYGLEGPWRDYVGWGNGFEQVSGQAVLTGMPDDRPASPGGYTDPAVGLHAVVATLAALEHRRTTGRGQLIEVSQIEVGACVGADAVIEYTLTGKVAPRLGNRARTMAPQGSYPAADGRRVALSVTDDQAWARLRDVLGDPEWAADAALATTEGRLARHDDIDTALADWVGQDTASARTELLLRHGVAASVVAVASDFPDDPHLAARGYYQTLTHPVMGDDAYPGWPMRFSAAPTLPHRRVAPLLGEHNREVLGGELGLSDADLARLEKDEIIGTRPVGLA